MTPTLVPIPRIVRPLLFQVPALALMSAAALRAETVEFDLESLAIPSGLFESVSTPYEEQGLRLSSSTGGITLIGTGNSSFTGRKAYIPSLLGSSSITMQLFSPTGRRFTVKSATIHPYYSGSSANIPFSGAWNGNVFTQTHATGPALAGTTVTFNSNFQRIGNLSWLMSYSGGLYNRFQISSIVVEFDGVLSTPAEIVVNEAAGTALVPIQLAHPRSTDTEVIREVAAVTATAGADFTVPGGQNFASVIIPAGQTSAVVEVPLVNDSTTEGIETFTIGFSANTPGTAFAGGATYATCTVKIASDDGVSTFPNWMAAHGLTSTAAGVDADPNGDGISNIECWLFRLNPAGPNPPAWLARRAAMSGGGDDPGLTFFVPAPLPSDVRIILSQSTDLGSWTEQTRRTGFGTGSLWTGSGAGRVIETISPSGRTITLRASAPVGRRPGVFLRNTYEHVSGGGAS